MTADGRHRADDQLLLMLASGTEIRTAATECGLSESTVYRRLNDLEFSTRLTQAQSRIWDDSLTKLTGASGRSVQTLEALLKSESDSIRLNTAKAILDYGMKLRESVDFDTRISLLEGSQNARDESSTDPRRAFGLRWSRRVMPAVLKDLMRHQDISTTIKFYVGQNAESTAEALYAAVSGDTSGDTTPESANEMKAQQAING